MTNGCDEVSKGFSHAFLFRLQTIREMEEGTMPALGSG